MTLQDKLSRNNLDFYGANFQDLKEFNTQYPDVKFDLATDNELNLVSELIVFMSENPGIVVDGILTGSEVLITTISGRTSTYDQTSDFNQLFHRYAAHFYMKGLTVFVEFTDDSDIKPLYRGKEF